MRNSNASQTPLMLLLLLASISVHAACPLDPVHFRVGADPTYCTHDNIKAAIDAVANTCPVIIEVTREHLYGGGYCDPNNPVGCHLSISGKNITLQGRADGETCFVLDQCIPAPCPAPSSTAPLVTLDGGSNGRVLSISGGNVNLRNLTITHGAADYNGKGGGIYYSGAGNLNIARSTISFNYAGYGAGIAVEGSGGTANLRLQDNTFVLSNSAQYSGGGVLVAGTSVLYAQQTPALIGLNEAIGEDPFSHVQVGGYGGGVEINGPARADIGSGGYGGLGVIYGNKAIDGGGLAVFAGQDSDSSVGLANLYTTDPSNPVTIQGNFASSRGGALYSKGYVSFISNTFTLASTCVGNGRIVDNAAPDGAIAYLDWDSDIANDYVGSRLYINTSNCGGTPSVACPPGAACNQAYDNVSTDENANPKPGSAIVVGKSSSFRADKLDLRGSTGSHLLYITGDNYSNYSDDGLLRSCLLADNNVTGTLIVDGAQTLHVENCTIAGNVIGGTTVAQGNSNSLLNSLIFQPDLPVGQFQQATYVLANNSTGLPASATVNTVVDPKFVDPQNSDYHLLLASPAVDYAGGLGGTDLDGYPRDVDLTAHTNTFGPRDLGAYERQSAFACDLNSDVVFCDGFEAQ